MKNVLVTGGTGAIGSAIVKEFTDRGYYVTSPSRDQLDLSYDIRLTDPQFDIVINNAGINPLNGIENIHDTVVMKVNYLGPLKIIQQCLPHMVKQKYGRIINIGSIWGNISNEKRSAYSASKSALDSLSRSITAEYGRYNILANTISPGFIATKLTYTNNSPEELEKKVEQIPVGRLGTSEEIAKLVYHLTAENSYISGQNIIIDGGFSCTRQ